MTRFKVGDTYISGDVPVVKIVTAAGVTVTPAEVEGDLVLTFTTSGGSSSTSREVAFAQPGTLVVATGAGAYPITHAATISGVIMRAGTAGTGTAGSPIAGSSIVCDVNKNGTTVFTTQANRPHIAAGANLSSLAVPNTGPATLVAGDYLTVDVNYVGSTVAGSDLTVIVQLTA